MNLYDTRPFPPLSCCRAPLAYESQFAVELLLQLTSPFALVTQRCSPWQLVILNVSCVCCSRNDCMGAVEKLHDKLAAYIWVCYGWKGMGMATQHYVRGSDTTAFAAGTCRPCYPARLVLAVRCVEHRICTRMHGQINTLYPKYLELVLSSSATAVSNELQVVAQHAMI